LLRRQAFEFQNSVFLGIKKKKILIVVLKFTIRVLLFKIVCEFVDIGKFENRTNITIKTENTIRYDNKMGLLEKYR